MTYTVLLGYNHKDKVKQEEEDEKEDEKMEVKEVYDFFEPSKTRVVGLKM